MDSLTAQILLESKLFSGLSAENLEKVYKYGRFDSYQKDDVIIREGQIKSYLCLLVEGSVDVVLPKAGIGFERINHVDLSMKKQGDCFGEYSFLDGKQASASVVAIEDCKVFAISKDNFMEFLEIDDFLAKKIYFNLSRMFVDKMRQIVQDSETFILV